MLKNKYLLPLILILILSFTLIVNCSWVFDVKEEINTATYDNVGLLIKTGSDTIIYFVREASAHLGTKGKIVKQVYTISTKSWGARSTVYEDANDDYDSRNVGGGIIGNNIYLFFHRLDISTPETPVGVDIGYKKSTDLTGSSWGDYTTIATGLSVFSSYGRIIPTATSGKYLQPFYGWNVYGESHYIKFFETVDSGDNWAVGDTIYSGATKYTETCVTYIGDSEMIALLRTEDGGYVKQAISSDNGANWSAPADTNLGANTCRKVPYIEYDSSTNKVIALYQDRSSPFEFKISNADADTIHSSSTSWGTPEVISTTSSISGYPSLVKTESNKYFFVEAHHKDNNDCDTVGGYYSTAPNLFSEYKYRIKLTVDASKIDSELTYFPVTIFFTSSQGEEIFTRFDADADYSKSAFTKADGVTLLYSEKELFDNSESKGIFHVSRDGWILSDSTGTDFYYYFDDDGVENTNYMGIINTITGAKVWNDEFIAVYHSVDATTSTILDSTSNSYDGTKKDAGEPATSTDGKIGLAQLYDGVNDYITNPTLLDTMPAALTIEIVSKITEKTGANHTLLTKYNINGTDRLYLFCKDDNTQFLQYEEHDNGITNVTFDTNWLLNTFQYLAITWDTVNGIILYKDGTSDGSSAGATTLPANGTYLDFCLGYEIKTSSLPFKGIIDEARVSSTQRNTAWKKGTYNTLWDSLLTYGSEEKAPVVTNVMFMFSNF